MKIEISRVLLKEKNTYIRLDYETKGTPATNNWYIIDTVNTVYGKMFILDNITYQLTETGGFSGFNRIGVLEDDLDKHFKQLI